MRCFLAIPLSDELKNHLFLVVQDIKKEFKKYKVKANFVPKKNLHITLMFLGELNEKEVIQMKNAISKIRFKSFKFKLKHLGVFPNENLSRVLWVGINPEKDVIALQKKIDTALLDIVGLVRDHEFGAHITIARTKHSPRIFTVIKNIQLLEIEQSVDSIVLYRSELHKDGAKYLLVEKFKVNKG